MTGLRGGGGGGTRGALQQSIELGELDPPKFVESNLVERDLRARLYWHLFPLICDRPRLGEEFVDLFVVGLEWVADGQLA
jgi:hypothetical protein